MQYEKEKKEPSVPQTDHETPPKKDSFQQKYNHSVVVHFSMREMHIFADAACPQFHKDHLKHEKLQLLICRSMLFPRYEDSFQEYQQLEDCVAEIQIVQQDLVTPGNQYYFLFHQKFCNIVDLSLDYKLLVSIII